MLVTERMQALGDHAKSSHQPPLRERRTIRDAGLQQDIVDESESSTIDESESSTPTDNSVAQSHPTTNDGSLAKTAILHEWENWSALNSDELDDPKVAEYFFRHLQMKKSHLLNFGSEDQRETVRGWLTRRGGL